MVGSVDSAVINRLVGTRLIKAADMEVMALVLGATIMAIVDEVVDGEAATFIRDSGVELHWWVPLKGDKSGGSSGRTARNVISSLNGSLAVSFFGFSLTFLLVCGSHHPPKNRCMFFYLCFRGFTVLFNLLYQLGFSETDLWLYSMARMTEESGVSERSQI
jgi:hypothetical protein